MDSTALTLLSASESSGSQMNKSQIKQGQTPDGSKDAPFARWILAVSDQNEPSERSVDQDQRPIEEWASSGPRMADEVASEFEGFESEPNGMNERNQLTNWLALLLLTLPEMRENGAGQLSAATDQLAIHDQEALLDMRLNISAEADMRSILEMLLQWFQGFDRSPSPQPWQAGLAGQPGDQAKSAKSAEMIQMILHRLNYVFPLEQIDLEKVKTKARGNMYELLHLLAQQWQKGSQSGFALDPHLGEKILAELKRMQAAASPVQENRARLTAVLKEMSAYLTRMDGEISRLTEENGNHHARARFADIPVHWPSSLLSQTKWLSQPKENGWETQEKVSPLKIESGTFWTSTAANHAGARKSQPHVPILRMQHLVADVHELFRIHLRRSPNEGISHIRVRLHPEHLGALDIRMMSSDGKITAQLLTGNRLAQEMLEKQIHQLRFAFMQQGIQVDKIEVAQHSTNNQASTHLQQFAQQDDDKGGPLNFNQSGHEGKSAEESSSEEDALAEDAYAEEAYPAAENIFSEMNGIEPEQRYADPRQIHDDQDQISGRTGATINFVV